MNKLVILGLMLGCLVAVGCSSSSNEEDQAVPGDDQEVKAGKAKLEGAWDVDSMNGADYKTQSGGARAIFVFGGGQAIFMHCTPTANSTECKESMDDRVAIPYTTTNGQLNTNIEILPAHIDYKIAGATLTLTAIQTKIVMHRLASFCSLDADCKAQGGATCDTQTNACK